MRLCRLINLWLGLLIFPIAAVIGTQSTNHATASGSDVLGGNEQEHLEEAFEEQGYYLQRLFLQYGENGTLTYEGLQKLLGSLGLGEVNVLEIHHGGPKHSSHSHTHSHDEESDGHNHQPHPSPDQATHTNKSTELYPSGSAVNTGGLPTRGTTNGDHAVSSYFPLPGKGQSVLENPSLLSNHPTKKHLHGNCLNVTQLLWNFGLGRASHITPAHFTFLCPALLYQIESGVCLRHSNADGGDAEGAISFLKALGWSSLALVVISLPSLIALVLAPLLPPARLHIFLCPMAALAVGTLCGDALLHLLPHARSGPHGDHQDSILKGLSVLGGLYLLFVVESLLELWRQYKRSKKSEHDPEPARELAALQGSQLPEQRVDSGLGNGHSHAPPASGPAGISSMAWMVAMGDGIHNLTDGLAIGVAFSQSLTVGLSTTIAVFCHELPHELGDLAVLLSAGWTVRRLAVFSALSTLLGFMGLLAGTALGHQWAHLSPWVLTLTAGVFLYIALADMMPEMLHGDRKSMSPLIHFLLQNVGLLTGGAIMLCIALFEEHISFNFSDG